MSCRGTALTALADDALDSAARDRVLAHLAGCDACRAEVEAQRALKGRLSRLADATPGPRPELIARLAGLAVPGVAPAAPTPPAADGAAVPVRPATAGPASRRPPDRRPFPRRDGARRRSRAARRTTVGGGLMLLGAGLALVLGGSGATSSSTPVDPGSEAFVVDFVSTTSGVPLADPASRAALLPRP